MSTKKKEKFPIHISINKIVTKSTSPDTVDINWTCGRKKSGTVEGIKLNSNIRKDIIFNTSFTRKSSGFKEKIIAFKMKQNKTTIAKFSLELTQVFSFKNHIGGIESKFKSETGEAFVVSFIVSFQPQNPHVGERLEDEKKEIETKEPKITPRGRASVSVAKGRPSVTTRVEERTGGPRTKNLPNEVKTEIRPQSVGSFVSITKSPNYFDSEEIKYIEEISSIDNYKGFMFKTSAEFAEHFAIFTEENKTIQEIKKQISNYSLLSCVLFSVLVGKNNEVLFKESIHQFTLKKLSFLDTQYLFLSLFETCVLLNAKNESKRVELWRECYDFCLSKTCLFADKLISILIDSYHFEPSPNFNEITSEMKKLRYPETMKSVLNYVFLFALDVKLYQTYLNKTSLTTNDGNKLLCSVCTFDPSMQNMPLCLELAKLLMLDDKKTIKDEDMRMGLCPHIPVDDIKVFLTCFISNTPSLTKGIVDLMGREMQQQRFLNYPFSAPYFKQDQIKELLKISSIRGVLSFSFKSTPFEDKPYV